MAKYTAALSAQNTSVYVCDIHQPRGFDSWFANVMATGTYGGGTVTYNLTFDGGSTLIPFNQDGTATAATQTAAGALNIRCGFANSQAASTQIAKLYASVATATSPSLVITVLDNR